MSSAFALAVAGAPACSWDHPGQNPFYGDVVAAVDRYRDIRPDVRARLKARMARRDYDDLVSIRRDSIEGRQRYDPAIRQMHFGNGSMCGSITRAAWTPQAEERGLVYCESDACILVPTVCRNVSRISRLPGGPVLARGPDGAPPPAGPGELVFAPPGAGNAADGAPATFVAQSAPTGADGGAPGIATGGGGNNGVTPVGPSAVPYYPVIPGGTLALPPAVPEPTPAALLALGLGLGGCALLVRRRRAGAQSPASNGAR